MNTPPSTNDALPADDCGTAWWQQLTRAERLPLMMSLVRRFNHDLRTPLNTLAGWTHLLERAAGDAARMQHGVEVMARNVREQTQLLQEFTSDAGILLDTLSMTPSDCVAADLLGRAVERLAPSLSLHEVSIDVADEAPGARIRADVLHVERLLYRLLLLAVRRAPHRAVLRPGVQRHNGHLQFELNGAAQRDEFEDTQLLDLRIASAIAHGAGGSLDVFRAAGHTHFRLSFDTLH